MNSQKTEMYLDVVKPFTGTEEEFLAVKDFHFKDWKLNGELHRTNGPARIGSDGSEFWMKNGKPHRIGGLAVLIPGKLEQIWEDGVLIKTILNQ